MKRILFGMVILLCALLSVLSATPVYAAVDFTKDGAAGQAIYVAGAPDRFPVERYDADSGTYVGAAPAFLALVAERTGLDFVYIRAGAQDRRGTLAGDRQVDLLFAFSDESDLLERGVEKIKLFSVMENGTPKDVYCVFTSVFGEKERAAIRSAAENLSKDDVARLFTADNSRLIRPRLFRIVVIVLGILLFAALVALAVFMVLFFRRKRTKDVFVDTATEIGNKKYFLQMFASSITDQTRELYYVIHFAFAIDRVNKNYGMEESDRILRYAADTIKQRIKDNEFCARIGDGAFAAAIHANGTEQAERRVEEILRVLNAYGEKYLREEIKELFNAGICALAIDDKNAEKVLYNADQAYHRAVDGKIAYVFVNHDVLNESRTKVSIREQAGEALDQHAFTPYVQFIVNAADGSICGGEILSRWENRLYGLLSPGNYLPILQEMGLIARHDLLMLEEACKLLEQWQSQGKDYFLACNLTRVTISDQALVDKVTSITDRYSFAKEKLILEVTENSLEEDKDSALHNILTLKEKGFRIALDDFASGYTAVMNLYEYAIDLVKLDRQLILDADRDRHAAALMKEIAEMCHKLQIRVLAEGVETESQAQQVRSVLCDYIQGYFYARALPLRELSGFAETYRAKSIPPVTELTSEAETVPAKDPPAMTEELPCDAPEKEPVELSAKAGDVPQNESEEENIMIEESKMKAAAKLQETAPVPADDCTEAKNTLHIQYGPYRLDLPGNIDIEPVSEILRAIQEAAD